ncbi:hypothetical protein GT347_02100 [Xylophilus rhododendri]|uniref:Uncharacterized protein n=1 Tax=Xylophilus rhododendri TaxID=2697032 RepID=A0A857J1Z0_9BURK|nr:hypothetical protein [Xylophilus rhododendri]QHI96885.1 hypothetical protein GT347_02100 [Xylophilus rhododendri]
MAAEGDWERSLAQGELVIADLLAVLRRYRELHPDCQAEMARRLVAGFEQLTARQLSAAPAAGPLLPPAVHSR